MHTSSGGASHTQRLAPARTLQAAVDLVSGPATGAVAAAITAAVNVPSRAGTSAEGRGSGPEARAGIGLVGRARASERGLDDRGGANRRARDVSGLDGSSLDGGREGEKGEEYSGESLHDELGHAGKSSRRSCPMCEKPYVGEVIVSLQGYDGFL